MKKTESLTIKNVNKLTLKDIENFYKGKIKVASLVLDVNKWANTKGLYEDEETYYVEGLEHDVYDLIELIVYSAKYDKKERADAYLNIFNKYVEVTKVKKLNIQKEYVSDTYVGVFSHVSTKMLDFDGYAINSIKLQPALSEYLNHKLGLLKQKIRIEKKYTSCLDDIKELEK